MATLSMSVMKLGAVTPLNFPIVRCSVTRDFRPCYHASPTQEGGLHDARLLSIASLSQADEREASMRTRPTSQTAQRDSQAAGRCAQRMYIVCSSLMLQGLAGSTRLSGPEKSASSSSACPGVMPAVDQMISCYWRMLDDLPADMVVTGTPCWTSTWDAAVDPMVARCVSSTGFFARAQEAAPIMLRAS